MPISTYLFFNGNCAEAMQFYAKTLGGQLELMTYGQSPDGMGHVNVSPEKIMHARLTLPQGVIMASDDGSGAPYRGMSGFAISLDFATAADVKRVFDGLAEGGQVWMPVQKTFWTEAFGAFVDRYGTPWMIAVGPA